MTTVHVPVPEHPPPTQPANMLPLVDAVSTTTWPEGYAAEHVVPNRPQVMPTGALVTVPWPDVATFSGYVTREKLAVTDIAAFIVTVQVPAPLHAPDHPTNVESAWDVAVNVTS